MRCNAQMENISSARRRGACPHRALPSRLRQRGVTLMIALIVLVIMTLAGIALMRSVDTTNIIAGNLAFQQSATHSGDIGVEAAIGWLEANNAGTYLDSNHNSIGVNCLGYTASREDPVGTSWDAWWNGLSACKTVSLLPDAAGNTVSYAIHRMCQTAGPQITSVCSISAFAVQGGNISSQGSDYFSLLYSGQVYFRITSRIDGPRGTRSYVQAIVAM